MIFYGNGNYRNINIFRYNNIKLNYNQLIYNKNKLFDDKLIHYHIFDKKEINHGV